MMGDPVVMICARAARSRQAANSMQASDPIFAAIQRHRSAWKALGACSDLDVEETKARRAGNKKAARAAVRAVDRLHKAVDKAEKNLIDVVPTSIAGVVALLAYAADHQAESNNWDRYRQVIMHRLAEALPKIAA
jgi:hypothetical protein